MVKLVNNLKSKYTTELGSLDYGDFFELNNTIYQYLYHYDVYKVVKKIKTGKEEFMGRTTKVCKLDVTVTINGYSKEE